MTESGPVSAMVTIAAIAAIALVWGGIRQVRQPESRLRGILMIVAALVLIGNIVILSL